MEKIETLSDCKFETIELGLSGHLASLKFTQADKANAMTKSFWIEFSRALDQLALSPEVRALIISGEGKHFSSGMDLSVFSNNENLNSGTARERERLRRLVLHLQGVFNKIESLPFPVLAEIKGACIGGAFDLACACDMRYATQNTFFVVQETNLAMMADLGVLQRLSKLIPAGVARELCFTGEQLAASRAYELGLLNGIFDTEAELKSHVQKTALLIAKKSPLAIAATKEAINYARDNSVNDSLSHAALLQSSILDGRDLLNAATALSKKTEAEFKDLLGTAAL